MGWRQGLAHLLAPRVCVRCGESLNSQEEYLCLNCLMELPRTGEHRSDFNEIHRRLGHQCMVERGAGWFHYTKGSEYAQLLVDAKYSNMPQIDYHLGRICALELKRDGFFDGIDLAVPMPMHWLKRALRGYNQAAEICRGIEEGIGLPWSSVLKAVKRHKVQSRQGREARYGNISGTMSATLDVGGLHVLLVDDIITTGASCIEAVRALQAQGPAAVSVLALGLTRRT